MLSGVVVAVPKGSRLVVGSSWRIGSELQRIVPSHMKCIVLFNSAHIGNLFQIRIKFLIADYRKYLTVRQLTFTLLQYHLGNIQQGNINVRVGLLPLCHYPKVAVKQ